jgi:GT2 family glycosyltransferase
VSWNTRSLLERCLRSLGDAASGLGIEVVVVDNASDDGSADAARAFPGVRVIENRENVGYARAMNQALAEAPREVDVLVALNSDTELPPGSLGALVDRLVEDPGIGLVAPRLVKLDGSTQHSVYRFPSLRLALSVALLPERLQRGWLARRLWLEGRAPHDRSGDVDWPVGAVHVMRASAVGDRPYSERWFMYVEDLDLCWRLARLGWRRSFAADISVVHVGNASGEQAWGDRQVERWLDASYDWFRSERGAVRTIAWGAVNVAGVTLHRQGAPTRLRHMRALKLALQGDVSAGRPGSEAATF